MLPVYIVDDSHLQVMILEKILSREGYKVHTFSNPQDLIDRLEGELPCLIISDIDMPRINGFELLKKVRRKTSYKNIPFFFISSQNDQNTVDKVREMGVDYFFQKPVNPADFSNKIGEYAVHY